MRRVKLGAVGSGGQSLSPQPPALPKWFRQYLSEGTTMKETDSMREMVIGRRERDTKLFKHGKGAWDP
jgi:hypothetical protein